MGDMFDEFMRELRKRQGRGGGGAPREPRRVGPDGEHPPEGGDGDGPREPRPIRQRGRGGRRPAGRSGNRRSFVLGVLVVILIAVLLFGRTAVDLATDVMWYRSVGYESVLWTRLGAQAGLFALGAVLAVAVLLGNLWLAGRLALPPAEGRGGALKGLIDRINEAARNAERPGMDWPSGQRSTGSVEIGELPSMLPLGRYVLIGFAVLVILGVAGGFASAWETILLWQNRVPFSATGGAVTDPVFGRDIGFFLFELPFQRFIQSLIVGLLVASLLVVGARYLLSALDEGLELTTPVRLHLGILAGLALIALAYGYQLDKLELAYSTRSETIGVVGVAYTDANAQFFAYDLLTILTGLAGALVAGASFTGWVWPVGATLAVWLVASIVVGRLYPEAIQRLVVAPNQLAQETPYINNNIAMTRLAFGFANGDGSPAWDASRRYQGEAPLSPTAIADEDDTFRNARLWDYRPLRDTLDQLQTIRRYYDFVDVDTDRYLIDGVQRQVMLSARELDLSGNPNAVGFVNQRIIFTHGVGLAMVPVNEVTTEGQPRLIVRNLPPVSSEGAPAIEEPRIYFGERPSGYVVVGAKQAEFDFPRGGQDPGATDTSGVETRWSGDTGISLGSTLPRLLFALRFGDLDLLISDQVTGGSQLLFHRTLADRVPRIAPFLRYDKDPYLVVDGSGRLVWIWDAYTTSDRFPHANGFDSRELGEVTGFGGDAFNYLRNSVKVTVDAYTGEMTFYVADPADPLIRAWQGVFPGVFRPLSQIPVDLGEHLRVPEEQFNVQTRMYGRYHVTDPGTFFQNDDLWTVPTGKSTEQSLPSEAYYVIMRMPGEPDPEFLLLQPMVPTNRPNMIAWVAARNDALNYGAVRVYNFPADTTVFGPAQIEARIDQDPEISAQFTLWGQSGSTVIRGNLIVVPVGDSLLYLQPVYLQSTASSFPEFQRIIVASPTEVVWASTLGESLRLLLEAQGQPGPSPSPSPGASPTPVPTPSPSGPAPSPGELPADVAGLIEYANTHFALAQQALRDGDFATYGREIELVEQALRELEQLVPPSAAP
ncbi:MAG TPA: UPF0182 family protein [Candidatus Limnocylindrales bacterium]